MPERENPESIDHNASSNQLLGLLEPTEDLTLADWQRFVAESDGSPDRHFHLIHTSMRLLDAWSSCSASALRSPIRTDTVQDVISQAATILGRYLDVQDEHISLPETTSYLRYQATEAESLSQVQFLSRRFDVHFPDADTRAAKSSLLDAWLSHRALRAEWQDYESTAAALRANSETQVPEGFTVTAVETVPYGVDYHTLHDVAYDLGAYNHAISLSREPFNPSEQDLQDASDLLRRALQLSDGIIPVGPGEAETRSFVLVHQDETDIYELSPHGFDPYSPTSEIKRYGNFVNRPVNVVPWAKLSFANPENQEITDAHLRQLAQMLNAITGQPEIDSTQPPETGEIFPGITIHQSPNEGFALMLDLDPNDKTATNLAVHKLLVWTTMNGGTLQS